MAVALVVIALVIGSLIFHFASPWWFTPIASNWGMIDDTVNLTFIVTGIVFVLVNAFLAYCVLKFRHKPGRKAHYEPESKKLEIWLTAVTSIGVAAMLAPGLLASVYVSGLARAERGAWPLSVAGLYGIDDAQLARYAKAARTREGFQRYLEEYVWNRTPKKNSSPAASRA